MICNPHRNFFGW